VSCGTSEKRKKMAETAKTVTETVKNKNKVTIALDEYNELVQKANRPVVTNVTVLRKTGEQAAKDNQLFGSLIAIVGTVLAIGGTIVAKKGKRHLA
jgi:phage-related minor tail protein